MTSSEYLSAVISILALGSVLSLTAYSFGKESKYRKDKIRRKEQKRILKLVPEIVRVAFIYAEDGLPGAAQDEIEWMIKGEKK